MNSLDYYIYKSILERLGSRFDYFQLHKFFSKDEIKAIGRLVKRGVLDIEIENERIWIVRR